MVIQMFWTCNNCLPPPKMLLEELYSLIHAQKNDTLFVILHLFCEMFNPHSCYIFYVNTVNLSQPSSPICHECSTIMYRWVDNKGMVKLLQWSSPWPLAVLCWPEFSLGLPQIRWHPKVGGSVVRLSSTLTELASTRDSWTLCAAPAPASVPGHCQTGARADTRVHTSTRTHTHMFQTREDRLEAKEMSITVESSEVKNKNVLKTKHRRT